MGSHITEKCVLAWQVRLRSLHDNNGNRGRTEARSSGEQTRRRLLARKRSRRNRYCMVLRGGSICLHGDVVVPILNPFKYFR
jgi:hypothetical protein